MGSKDRKAAELWRRTTVSDSTSLSRTPGVVMSSRTRSGLREGYLLATVGGSRRTFLGGVWDFGMRECALTRAFAYIGRQGGWGASFRDPPWASCRFEIGGTAIDLLFEGVV